MLGGGQQALIINHDIYLSSTLLMSFFCDTISAIAVLPSRCAHYWKILLLMLAESIILAEYFTVKKPREILMRVITLVMVRCIHDS